MTVQRSTPSTSLYVDTDDPETGTRGPFYPSYRTGRRERLYGWRCGNCGSDETAVDTMGRIHCEQCGNWHKPSRWDRGY